MSNQGNSCNNGNDNDETPPSNSAPRVGEGMEPPSLVSLLLGTPPSPSEPSPLTGNTRTRSLSVMSDVERRRFLSDILTSALAIADEQIREFGNDEDDIRHREEDDPARGNQ